MKKQLTFKTKVNMAVRSSKVKITRYPESKKPRPI